MIPVRPRKPVVDRTDFQILVERVEALEKALAEATPKRGRKPGKQEDLDQSEE